MPTRGGLWLPDTCKVGRLVRRPGGPAAVSNAEVFKRLTPLIDEGYGENGEKGARDGVTETEGGSLMGQGPLGMERRLYLDTCAGAPSS